MNAEVSGSRRSRLLAELGIVRYRLRGTTTDASTHVVASTATVMIDTPAPPATHIVKPTISVNAAGITEPPAGGIEAAIWTQVLAWLGYGADEIVWARGDGAIALPPTRNWATPQGKRGLWNALKAHARSER